MRVLGGFLAVDGGLFQKAVAIGRLRAANSLSSTPARVSPARMRGVICIAALSGTTLPA
jgi:hypothetical protein